MKSENIDKLATALSKAQAQIEGAKKDSDNPYFKSKYADLASVWDACKKPLTDNGLSIVQTTDILNERPVLKTMLIHASGQFIEGVYPIVSAKQDAQSMVAALTYARRAALAAIAGVAAVDDDGNEAAGLGPINAPKPQAKPLPNLAPSGKEALMQPAKKQSPPYAKISVQQAKRLFAIAAKSNITKDILEAKIRQVTGIANVYDIHPDKYEEICAWAESSGGHPTKQAISDLNPPDFMKEDMPWGDEK